MSSPYNDIAAAATWLRLHAFPRARPRHGPRIGAEVEFIVHDTSTHDVARYGNGRGRLGRFLDEHARRHGWCITQSAKGAPRWVLPNGGAVTLEPGGQIEYSAPPYPAAHQLLADLERVIPPLVREAADAQLELLGVGIDPVHDLARTPLQLDVERYRVMDAYFGARGEAGRRMMRQTAAVQLNIDAWHEPQLTWRVLNALAPCVVALTANSAVYAGAPSGWASYRAATWRELDNTRTGLLGMSGDPALEYARFALGAGAMVDDPFGEGWADHLSTLFPEVRPRGWFELRSADAMAPDRYAALILPISTIVRDTRALHECAELLGAPEPALLLRAARVALDDATLQRLASGVLDIAARAATRRRSAEEAESITDQYAVIRQFATAHKSVPAEN